MGQPDLSEKGLTSYPDVAADIVNVFVYNGKPVIQEKDLKPYITNETIVKTEGKLKGLYRDNCMEHIRNGTRYAIFGFENQTDIDHTMPLRIMGYDYSVYSRQVEEIISQNKKHHQEANFLSDFSFIAKYLNRYYNKNQLLNELQKEDTIYSSLRSAAN